MISSVFNAAVGPALSLQNVLLKNVLSAYFITFFVPKIAFIAYPLPSDLPNIAISGFEYFMFAPRKSKLAPFRKNTRVYSCILIKNDIPYEWRGRYNEDTDLSLRALKDGWATILFQAFLADKTQTMTMKGGNTEDLYEIQDGRLKMAESLQKQHPDVARVTWKWGRWQHTVNYKPFKNNKLKLKKGLNIPNRVNNYGMKLIKITNS